MIKLTLIEKDYDTVLKTFNFINSINIPNFTLNRIYKTFQTFNSSLENKSYTDIIISTTNTITLNTLIKTKIHFPTLLIDYSSFSVYIKNNTNKIKIIQKNSLNEMTDTLSKIIKHYVDNLTKNEQKIRHKVIQELSYLNSNPNHIGYTYIIECILLLIKYQYTFSDNLTKTIYPHLVKKYNKSLNNIKCNIRNACEYMYNNCDKNIFNNYLKIDYSTYPGPKKIMNAIINHII